MKEKRSIRKLEEIEKEYFRSVDKLLNSEETIELMKKVKVGDDASREKVILSNLRLVSYIARQYKYKNPALEFSDLMNEGVIGLIEGMSSYDPYVGSKLSTYVYFYIRSKVRYYSVNNFKVLTYPMNYLENSIKIQSYVYDFYKLNGRIPSVNEIVKELNIEKSMVELIRLKEYEVISLNVKEDFLIEGQKFEEIPDLDMTCVQEDGIISSMQSDVNELFDKLTEKEKHIIMMRMGFLGNACSLQKIADIYGVTAEAIRQIEVKALRKMRPQAKRRKLNLYLQK